MEMILSDVPYTKTREARMELTTPTLQGKRFNHHSYFAQNLLFIYFIYEPPRGKTNNVVFGTGPTQIRLYSHRKWLETGNFGFRK